MTRDVFKFHPGARFSSADGWHAVVRVFKNNKPVGSSTGRRPLPTELIARAHAIRTAQDVSRTLALNGFNVAVVLPKQRSLPSERLAGAVEGTRLLQVQV